MADDTIQDDDAARREAARVWSRQVWWLIGGAVASGIVAAFLQAMGQEEKRFLLVMAAMGLATGVIVNGLGVAAMARRFRAGEVGVGDLVMHGLAVVPLFLIYAVLTSAGAGLLGMGAAMLFRALLGGGAHP